MPRTFYSHKNVYVAVSLPTDYNRVNDLVIEQPAVLLYNMLKRKFILQMSISKRKS